MLSSLDDVLCSQHNFSGRRALRLFLLESEWGLSGKLKTATLISIQKNFGEVAAEVFPRWRGKFIGGEGGERHQIMSQKNLNWDQNQNNKPK